MTSAVLTAERWQELESHQDEFTCYSAALATWLAAGDEQWAAVVNPGLWLRIVEAPDDLFGFAYFPPPLRARLGLVRTGAVEQPDAIEGIRVELGRSGRVIVAGDGYHLPWHVAYRRVHAPHWYVLFAGEHALEVADPFACRNELGVQQTHRGTLAADDLPSLLPGLPGDDPIHTLREVYALGDELEVGDGLRYAWFAADDVSDAREPAGFDGPDAIQRLAVHFRRHGQEPGAYAQADDIWSIARHRAFTYRLAQSHADPGVRAWATEHGAPLAKRWGHIAPLLMQAVLSLRGGRAASPSVPDMLERLAEHERAAAQGLPSDSFTIPSELRRR